MNKNELDLEFNTAMSHTEIRTIWCNRDPEIDYDYSGCIRGRFIAINLIADGDRETPEQREVRLRIENAGGIHMTITPENLEKMIIVIGTLGLARQSGDDL